MMLDLLLAPVALLHTIALARVSHCCAPFLGHPVVPCAGPKARGGEQRGGDLG
jgi:hypothetical protein